MFDGEKLKAIRGKRAQTDLATAIRKHGFGTTQTTISRWESGQQPHADVLPYLALELGCQIEDFYDAKSAPSEEVAQSGEPFCEGDRGVARQSDKGRSRPRTSRKGVTA